MRLTEEQKALIGDAEMRLARSIAARRSSGEDRFTRGEVRAAAYQGLVEAASRYDSRHGSGANFRSYAWPRINGAITDYYRERSDGTRGGESVSVFSYSSSRREESSAWLASSCLASWSPPPRFEEHDSLAGITRFLSQPYRRCVELLYSDESPTQESVAKTMGYTPSMVSKLHRMAIDMLREEFGVKGVHPARFTFDGCCPRSCRSAKS